MPDDMIVGAVADVGAGCDGTAHIRQYRCCWNYHTTTSHIGHAGGIARWCVPMQAWELTSRVIHCWVVISSKPKRRHMAHIRASLYLSCGATTIHSLCLSFVLLEQQRRWRRRRRRWQWWWQWRHICCCSCHPLSIRHHKNYIPIRHRLLSTFYFDLLIDVYEYWYWYYYLLFWCNTAGTDKEMECVIPHHSSKIYLFRHNII